jgi:hypothetical protein
VSLFQAARQWSRMSVYDVDTRFEIQFSLMNCQMLSTGFSSGAFTGNGTRVILGAAFSLRETYQPAW